MNGYPLWSSVKAMHQMRCSLSCWPPLFETLTYNSPSFNDTCHLPMYITTRKEMRSKGKETERNAKGQLSIPSSGVPSWFPPRPGRLLFTEPSYPVLGFHLALGFGVRGWWTEEGSKSLRLTLLHLWVLHHFTLPLDSWDSYCLVCSVFGSFFLEFLV